MLLGAHIINLHLLLIDLAGDVSFLHVVLVNHAGLLLDLVKDLLFLLLEGLVLLLFFFYLLFNCLGVGLEFFQVGFEVLNGLTKVLIALADADGFIAVLHVLALEGFDLIFLLLFILLHDEQLAFKVAVLDVLLLDPELSVCDLPIHLLYLPGDTFDFGDKTLSRLDFLVLYLILDVLLVVLKQMNLGLQCGTTLLDGLNIPVNVRESVFKLFECLLVLFLLLLCLL
jgi:hypothetical protein